MTGQPMVEELRAAVAEEYPVLKAQVAELTELSQRALREAEAVRAAAHVPEDWPYGLASWINQRLYAAYIGEYFSAEVMEQIRIGLLIFPESPVYRRMTAAETKAAQREIALEQARKDIIQLSLLVREAIPESMWPAFVTRILAREQVECDTLRTQIARLEAENERLRAELDALRAEQ